MAATIQSYRAPCWSSPSASFWSTWSWTCCTPSWIHGSRMRDDLRRLRANRLTVIGTMLTLLIVALALLANQVAPYDPLVLAATSVTVSVILGSALGLFAGYFGGAIDLVIGRIMDVLFSFPALLLAIAVAAMLGPGVRNTALAIAVVYTPLFARVIRGPVISERHRDYVLAARVIGASHAAIIYRHILPNVVSPIIIQTSAALSTAILIEAALSYIGLGTQPPAPSWGTMLSEGRTFLETAPWMSIFPGLAIALTVLAFNLVGDGLRDAFDPTLS